MAEHQAQQQRPSEGLKSLLPEKGPSTSQVLAVVTLFPIGGILLTLAGLTLAGTVIGLAVTTPLFVIFSPVLVPAAITVALAVTGFLASGALGITALSSLTWLFNQLRQVRGTAKEQMEQAKRRIQEAAQQAGQKTEKTGQQIQSRAQT
ncbi:hypothetical protein Scep_021227 [Stephania cephalantha]|uniref:Oleosin n=1 Tax=Stephania cephalantha TaxID=152367 RepID=A0AAP0HWP1_9MAGN